MSPERDGSDRQIRLEALLDQQPLRIRQWSQAVLLQLLLASSGFVIQALSFALPALLRDWHVSSASLSGAFSLHLLGITVGALSFGRLGDRHGRRTLLVASAALQALATFGCLLAHSATQMALLRLIAGVGVGGMTPNAVSLAMEISPRRRRTLFTTLVLSGVAFGSSLPPLVVRYLVPGHGWQAIFWVAAIATSILLAALIAWMPESLLYLARHPHRHGELLHHLKRMAPGLEATTGTAVNIQDQDTAHRHGFLDLFHGRLLLITTCIWIMYAGAMLAMHLITSWLPVLLEGAGLPATRAANLTGIVHLAGMAATLSSTVLLSRFGTVWLITLFLVAFVSVAALAVLGFSTSYIVLLIAGIGFGMVGCQGALGAIAGHVYPSAFRPTGVGAAIAVGRFGSMMGPLAGGAFQAAGYSSQALFTLPLWALGAAIAAALTFSMRSGYRPGGD